MLSIAIAEKSLLLARVIEQQKQSTSAKQRINLLLDVSILQSQLSYLLAIRNDSK
jgi:hypothetical protein